MSMSTRRLSRKIRKTHRKVAKRIHRDQALLAVLTPYQK